MTVLELSRWQFGITTVYHFIFVPLTLSLSYLVAGMQTAWLIKKDDVYLRMTKFFGKIFLINFAVGVVTGIVQEFQFGMNWSDYSKFVGNVFGAPLAMEALLTFFLESTFIGLWVFGWNKLPPRVHLATIWLTAIGTSLSAFFILAANSWMQHPVGYQVDPVTHRVLLTDIWAVLTNSTLLAAWPHVLFAAQCGQDLDPNALTLRLQPNEGISLRFGAKAPAPTLTIRSVNMDFLYGSAFLSDVPEAYETLILDAIRGDGTLFTRQDGVERAWQICDPLIAQWQTGTPQLYEAGSWGPEMANELINRDGRRWRRP